MRLEPSKCEYLKPELEYLGHIITKDGVKPNPEKLSAIQNFRQLENVKDVQSFLGLAGYYRKFIKNFSSIARPLTRLTQKEIIFDWTTDCEKAFFDLKHELISAPVLKFPNFEEKFVLTTDASNQGLGAVLSQNNHPCLFISRTLNKAEEKYTTSEKELLAIVWAMKRLRQYLLGKKFKIQTDHRALVWLHNVKDPSSRLLRWRLRMEEYDYEIEYVKGKENKVADCLSRLFPITTDILQQAAEESGIVEENNISIETNKKDTSQATESKEKPTIKEIKKVTGKIKIDLQEEFNKWKLKPKRGDNVKTKPNAIGKLWKNITKEEMMSENEKEWLNKLFLKITEVNVDLTIVKFSFGDPLFTPVQKETLKEMVEFLSKYFYDRKFFLCFTPTRELTKEEKETIIKEAHSTHLGEMNTLERAKRIGLWTGMDQEIKNYVKKCTICQLHKTTRIKYQIESIIPDVPIEPNDKIAMDIYGPLPVTIKGNKYILSIQDRLTRKKLPKILSKI